MTPEQFVYWLQGFAEVNGKGITPTYDQWEMIREHLDTVFVKVTGKNNQPLICPGVQPVPMPTYPTAPQNPWDNHIAYC